MELFLLFQRPQINGTILYEFWKLQHAVKVVQIPSLILYTYKSFIVIINFFFWKNISRVFQTKTTKNISIQLLMGVWIDNGIDQLLTVCFFNNNSDADEKEENFKVFNKLPVINYFYEVNSRLLMSYFSVFIESARFDRVSG